MPQGDKRKYTDKQKRQAEHIEKGYEERGVPKEEAERRAWATSTRCTTAARSPAAAVTANPKITSQCARVGVRPTSGNGNRAGSDGCQTGVRHHSDPNSARQRCCDRDDVFCGDFGERLVDQRRELAADVGRVRQHLDHQHEHEPRLGIDPVHRRVGARPAERALPSRARSRRSDPSSRTRGRTRARSASAACRPGWWSSARPCAARGCARRRARRRCAIISRKRA